MGFGAFAPAWFENKFAHKAITIGSSATEIKVDTTRDPERGGVAIFNDSDEIMYTGDASVTTSGATKGYPLMPKQERYLPISDIPAYAITESGGKTMIVLEFG